MVETVEVVVEKLHELRRRAHDSAPAPTLAAARRLVDEAREVLQAFHDAEARHVRRGLAGDFPFAAAQEELRTWRLRFAAEVEELRRRFGSLLSEREAGALRRIDLVARRAPLTSPEDLERIAAERDARRRRPAMA